MNGFMLSWRDLDPVILPNAQLGVPSIVSPLSPRLATGCGYVKVFSTEAVALQSLGFFAKPMPEHAEIAALQQLTAATLIARPELLNAGDCFVAANEDIVAFKANLLVSSYDRRMADEWLPIACALNRSTLGWIRMDSSSGLAEGIFLERGGEGEFRTPFEAAFLYKNAILTVVSDAEVTMDWKPKKV
jgi:hypothetical protein